MGGRIIVESVAGCLWNRWPDGRGIRKKTEKSLNIWTCDVVGPRKSKQLKGYLLIDPLTIFSEVPYDNVSLSLKSELLESPE